MRKHPLALEFETKHHEYFDVEICETGNDLVYHFWPAVGETDFPPGFDAELEKSFQNILPDDADVRADYMDRKEAAAIIRFGADVNEDAEPLPTYYVRVVGWANNPMADRFLKREVLENIDNALKEIFHDSSEELSDPPRSSPVPSRKRRGKRKRGRVNRK